MEDDGSNDLIIELMNEIESLREEKKKLKERILELEMDKTSEDDNYGYYDGWTEKMEGE